MACEQTGNSTQRPKGAARFKGSSRRATQISVWNLHFKLTLCVNCSITNSLIYSLRINSFVYLHSLYGSRGIHDTLVSSWYLPHFIAPGRGNNSQKVTTDHVATLFQFSSRSIHSLLYFIHLGCLKSVFPFCKLHFLGTYILQALYS